ncbi:flavodoxin-like fold protein [Paramarasmius palmivorus]|uniref:Flavodoxin-like fold protein n=1 Tax=Paramarasmius palmivorus TaxID=297713 RepID=A0AAW0C7X2_9AGAR
MCFGKRQKDLFDDNRDKAEKKPSSEPAPTTQSTTTETKMSSPKVAIIIYTLYGHVATLAESVKKGVEAAGGQVTIYQVPETLPEDILAKMHAPPKPSYPVISAADLPQFDAFLFGIPTRYGNFPAQWKAFWDSTGQLWATGALHGKFAGIFVSTATLGGGQEVTVSNSISTLAHHGIVFVPLGYKNAFAQLSNLDEVHGGSAWGAGSFAGPTGARQPTTLEKEVAEIQGKTFYEFVSKHKF